MSNKSQINQLSKREILESLSYRQQQESSTLNRLIVAVAVASGMEPEAVAVKFADGASMSGFIERFNKALDQEFAKREEASKNQNAGSEIIQPVIKEAKE